MDANACIDLISPGPCCFLPGDPQLWLRKGIFHTGLRIKRFLVTYQHKHTVYPISLIQCTSRERPQFWRMHRPISHAGQRPFFQCTS